MNTLILCMSLQDEKDLAGVHMDSGHDRDLKRNLSAFTAELGKIFEPWVTTYSVVSL